MSPPAGVRCCMAVPRPGNHEKALKALEAGSGQDGLVLTEAQLDGSKNLVDRQHFRFHRVGWIRSKSMGERPET